MTIAKDTLCMIRAGELAHRDILGWHCAVVDGPIDARYFCTSTNRWCNAISPLYHVSIPSIPIPSNYAHVLTASDLLPIAPDETTKQEERMADKFEKWLLAKEA